MCLRNRGLHRASAGLAGDRQEVSSCQLPGLQIHHHAPQQVRQAQTDTQRVEILSLGLQQQLEQLLDVQMYVMTLKASQRVSSFRLKTLSPDVSWHGNSGALTSS